MLVEFGVIVMAGYSCQSVVLFIAAVAGVVLLSAHAQSFEKSSHRLLATAKLKKADEQKVITFMQATTAEDFDDLEFDETAHYDEPGVVPELPLIKLFYDDPLEVGQAVTVGCLSRNGDPTADIFWYLDNQQLNETVLEFEEAGDDRTTSNTLSIVQWNVKIGDDGKILTCQARHPGYLKGFVETKHKLNVNYAPTRQPLKVISGVNHGKPMEISVSFRSNPKPTTIKWLVGDTKIYYGAKTSKCVSREIKAIGHNFWSASLHIANVTDEDFVSTYKLQVRNPIGSADYLVQLAAAVDKIEKLTSTEAPDDGEDEELTTTEGSDKTTVLLEDLDDQTIISNIYVETEVEIKTTTTIDETLPETTLEPFDTTTDKDELDSVEAETDIIDEFTTEIEPSTSTQEVFEPSIDSSDLLTSTPKYKPETGNDRDLSKTKVSKVVIFKRPIFVDSSSTSDVKAGKTNGSENDFSLHFVQTSLTEVVAKAVVFWKTSLLVILTIVLILFFSYHRRRIVKLKAEIIQKNLGSSYNAGFNQSLSSFPHSMNAYTPTYFPRRLALDQKLPISLSDYDSSSRSRSNLYSQTYNSSFHSYESIIDLHDNDQLREKRIDEDNESGEHIYAEIPFKNELNAQSNLATSKHDHNHLEDHTEPLNIEAPHIYHAVIRQGSDPEENDVKNLPIESTYI